MEYFMYTWLEGFGAWGGLAYTWLVGSLGRRMLASIRLRI